MFDTDDPPAPLVRYCVREGKEVLALLLIVGWCSTTRSDPAAVTAQPEATRSQASAAIPETAPATEPVAIRSSQDPAVPEQPVTAVPTPPMDAPAPLPPATIAAPPELPALTAAAIAPASSPVPNPVVRAVAFNEAGEQTRDLRGLTLLGEGIHRFWQGQYRVAIENLHEAHQHNPDDAATLYFLALAHRRLGESGHAQRTLLDAVSLESRQPIPNYGRLMERVQGHDRLWIEKARHGRGAL